MNLTQEALERIKREKEEEYERRLESQMDDHVWVH